MSDLAKIGSTTGYEVNINDKSTNPPYGTGGIPNVAPAVVQLKAGGQWNVYEITAKGPQITARTQRRSDHRRARQQVRQRPVRAAIRRGRGEIPQGADQADLARFRTLLKKSPALAPGFF